MSNQRKLGPGLVPIPPGLDTRDPRKAREDAALDAIDERLAAGAISAEEADREILEIVLKERFGYLPADAVEEMRRVGLELLEEPEFVETRAHVDTDPTEGEQ